MMNAIAAYRETDNSRAYSETPARLIAMLYDGVADQCRKASFSCRLSEHEQKSEAVRRALQIISEGLVGNLSIPDGKHEKIVDTLCDFYMMSMTQICKANADNDAVAFDAIAKNFSEVSEAWKSI